VGVGVVAVLVAGGLAFANAVASSQVADNARALHWTNSTLGTASLARAALNQVTVFDELVGTGLVEATDVDLAHREFVELAERFNELAATYWGDGSRSIVATYDAALTEAAQAVERGDAAAARAHLDNAIGPTFVALRSSLSEEQAGIVDRIEDTEALAGRVAGGVRFLVSLLIPAIAVFSYRVIARRQVRELQVEADLRVAAAESISRAKDDFAAGLSHELRTPLTSIYGFAEVLADKPADPVVGQEIASMISVEAANLTRMVDDLLAASRLEQLGIAVSSGEVAWRSVIDQVLSRFRRERVEIDVVSADGVVLADRGWLRHVLTNLVSNAHRHGGPTIEISTSVEGDRAVCRVRDDGAGVPGEQLDRLFDKFLHDGSAPLLMGSVGLGLAVAARVTAAMGGELVHRRDVGWTEFAVVLPLAEPAIRSDDAAVAG
jgi:signal transduction histidine kinase